METRYVTDDDNPAERYRLYRMCACITCTETPGKIGEERCYTCRGEGRIHDLVATARDPESLGVAIVTLARELEFEGCPIGILDTQPEHPKQLKWLVRPWQPSTRNVSDAAKLLRAQR